MLCLTKAVSAADVPGGEYMGDAQVQFFKGLLDARFAELTIRLEKSKESIATPEHSADEVDRAAHEADRTLELRMIERDRMSLNDTRKALTRIADGSYGYCDSTGEEIGHARLVLNPSSIYSVEAMQKQESYLKHQRRR